MSSQQKYRLIVVADPGVPSRRVRSVEESFAEQAQQLVAGELEVSVETRTVRMRSDETLDITAMRELDSAHLKADAVLVLTEVPRYVEEKPLVAEVFPEESAAVISCPSLGAWRTKHRIQAAFLDCVRQLLPSADPNAQEDSSGLGGPWKPAAEGDSSRLFARSWTGAPRMVLGMTAANNPWRTAPKLSRALAAASATGAFGIFYSSVWQMAEALSLGRLLMIAATAIISMVAWLIVMNQLWDKPVHQRLRRVVALYNGSTILTLLICVTMLYLALVALILIGGLVIIEPGFMSETIGTDVGFTSYLDIAWLSAALGVIAGAIGSTFDSNTDVRQLTHGQRERQRRQDEELDHSRGAELNDYTDGQSVPRTVLRPEQ
ncbi:hypothetical protein [Nesterenkonia lutea]|uniref:5,10-methylene-tetrahydrofolate dehydrogenase n=1 Tax=Nesterenkonia lutea TaxID=272919 RepID=A0ABR9JAL2_9MICC|nr:hypothetical protein [Nesterenkonia lutea]MBE1522965.1 hypothetical protein [Nesterenkonia lutea]